MRKYILEICCGSADDVFAAARGGADRVELNSALYLGGLTTSAGTFRRALDAKIPIMAMVRPRCGGFCYTEREFESMLEDVSFFSGAGASGLVFGVLNSDGTLDARRNRMLVEAAGDREKIFHRAFDVVPDWRRAMDELTELGFDRILTSGQAPSAVEGAERLREMVDYAAGRIEILPGGGIRPHNIKELLEKTGCRQAHASAGSVCVDSSCHGAASVHFGAEGMPEDQYTVTDVKKVRALCVDF